MLAELDDLTACARLECRQRVVVVVELGPLLVDQPRGPRGAVDEQPDDADQYVARPPEISKHAPVEKLISSLASQQIRAATSAGLPIRASGMRAVM